MESTRASTPTRLLNYPLRSFTVPDSGGCLNVATHTYHYAGGHAERHACKAAQAGLPEWKDYLEESEPCVTSQRSTLWVEPPLVQDFGLHGLGTSSPPVKGPGEASADGRGPCIYEFRRYQLVLGYDTVPRFLDLYSTGLPSKLSASGTDPSTSLLTVMYTEVGNLNEVIELWRHGGGTGAMEASRQAARGAAAWREAIGEIAGISRTFTSTIHKPLDFSPWQ